MFMAVCCRGRRKRRSRWGDAMRGMDIVSGVSLEDRAHLRQSIETILTTPIGSRVMRRDFGSKMFDLIDAPLTPETLVLIYAGAAAALAKWEPRLKVTAIHAARGSGGAGHLEITLTGIYLPDGQAIKLEGLTV